MFQLPESVKPTPPRDQWLILTGHEPSEYVCPCCELQPERPQEAPPMYCRPAGEDRPLVGSPGATL